MSDEEKMKRAAEIDAAIKKADADKEAAPDDKDDKVDQILSGITKLGEALEGLGVRVDALEGAGKKDDEPEKAVDAMLEKTSMTATERADAERNDKIAKADAQSRCDHVASMFCRQAPAPMDGEKTLAYRKRLLRPYIEHSAEFRQVDTDALDGKVFDAVERRIYADAAIAGRNPISPDGRLMERVTTDSTGRRITTFHGPTTFIRQMSGNRSRRVDMGALAAFANAARHSG